MEDVIDGAGSSSAVLTVDESDLKSYDKEFILEAVQAYLFPGFVHYSERASIRLYASPTDETDLEMLKTRGDFSIDGCKPKIEISPTTPEGCNRKMLLLTYYLHEKKETVPFNKQLIANTENIAKILGRQLNCAFFYSDHHLYGRSGYFSTKFKPKESK
jgi:hypothetical protein